jgi:hypothetical protein
VKVAFGVVCAGAFAFLGFMTGVIFVYMLGLKP